jgi:hypothetical protein
LYVYDSNHALREVSNDSDCVINTILFIHEHLHSVWLLILHIIVLVLLTRNKLLDY